MKNQKGLDWENGSARELIPAPNSKLTPELVSPAPKLPPLGLPFLARGTASQPETPPSPPTSSQMPDSWWFYLSISQICPPLFSVLAADGGPQLWPESLPPPHLCFQLPPPPLQPEHSQSRGPLPGLNPSLASPRPPGAQKLLGPAHPVPADLSGFTLLRLPTWRPPSRWYPSP